MYWWKIVFTAPLFNIRDLAYIYVSTEHITFLCCHLYCLLVPLWCIKITQIAALVNKLVPCAWLLSGTLEVWRYDYAYTRTLACFHRDSYLDLLSAMWFCLCCYYCCYRTFPWH